MKYMFALTTDEGSQEGTFLAGRDGYPIHVSDKGAEVWAGIASTPDLDVFGLDANLPWPSHIIKGALDSYEVVHLDEHGDLVLRGEYDDYYIVPQDEFLDFPGHMVEGCPTWNVSRYTLATCNCGTMFLYHVDSQPIGCSKCVAA